MNDIFDNMFVQQGWQCPICKRVYSPSTMMCLYCGNYETTITTNTNEVIKDKFKLDSPSTQSNSNKDK